MTIKNAFWLIPLLAMFWMVNSGYFKELLLIFGMLSVLGVAAITWRLSKIDGEYIPPIWPAWRLPGYLAWLGLEIIKSNIDVVRCVWAGPGSISPNIIKVKASQKTDLGLVLYANSITLTPGTITLRVNGNELTVHALTASSAAGVESGIMDRKVSALENA